MKTLPAELLSQVAFHACTDGGHTGASLSLVSKHLRDAVHAARFFTVSFTSCPIRVTKFLDSFNVQRARLRDTIPRVRHLLLALVPVDGGCTRLSYTR